MTDDELDTGRRQKLRKRSAQQDANGEPEGDLRGGEPASANGEPGGPPWKQLMEEVVAPENVARAMKRVRANKGSPGIDGMTVDELAEHWHRNEGILREQLLSGTYVSAAVRRVTIPKSDGGNRGASLITVVKELTQYLRGWKQYFGICEVARPRQELDEWLRSRLRLLQSNSGSAARRPTHGSWPWAARKVPRSIPRRTSGDGGLQPIRRA